MEAFFGVFDGHGGKAAAEFSPPTTCPGSWRRSCERARMTAVEEAVRRAYLRTDADFSSASASTSSAQGGACCVPALLREGRLVVSMGGAGAGHHQDARCDFLVLASDGLWDKVGEQEAVVLRLLVELAASRGSTDDITVLVVSFSAMGDGLYL